MPDGETLPHNADDSVTALEQKAEAERSARMKKDIEDNRRDGKPVPLPVYVPPTPIENISPDEKYL